MVEDLIIAPTRSYTPQHGLRLTSKVGRMKGMDAMASKDIEKLFREKDERKKSDSLLVEDDAPGQKSSKQPNPQRRLDRPARQDTPKAR